MYFHVIDIALERVGATDEEIDQLKDMVRHRLFAVRNGKRPLITTLAGRGDMSAQLRFNVLRAFVETRVRRGQTIVYSLNTSVVEEITTAVLDIFQPRTKVAGARRARASR